MRRFTHTFPQRISAFLLCLALLVGLLPATAMAAEEDESSKAIMLGTNGIESPTGTEATGGQYYTPNSYIYFGSYNGTPIKWRVLDAETANDGSTDGMFLLSEYLLGTTQFASSSNAWQGSTAQNWCNNFAGDTENFSTTEQAAMLEITKTDNTTQLYSLSWGESSLDAETLFFLSAEELANYVGNYDGAPGLVATYAENGSAGAWWLRSPYAYISSYAGFVTDNGTVSSLGVDYDWAARPAFNLDLNSVLFTSAAEGGKSSGAVGADALQPVSEYAGNEWKLTLLDDEHKDFEISNTTINGDGDTIAFSYSGAQTGTNEYISVVIEDSGAITHYGRILQPGSASGTASFTLPAGVTLGDTTKLYVFNEQYNGGENDDTQLTDYASQLCEVTFDTTAPALTAGATTRDSETSATVKFTSDEAGSYYYVVDNNATAPDSIDTSGEGASCSANTETTISLNSLPGEYIHIVVKDAVNNVSDILTIQIPAYTYTLTVNLNGGSGNTTGGQYPAGKVVNIDAGRRSNYRFAGWTSSNGGTFADASSASTTFTMPAGNVTITANWQYDSPYIPPTKPDGPSTGASDGWEDIREEIADADKGDTITIDMNGETEVPGEIFEEVAGKDVTVEFELEDGISWTVNGQDIPTATDFSDLDLGVDLGTSGIDVDVINSVTGELGSVQITLAHDGEFGFALTLTAPLGKENAGYWANLYHYGEAGETLDFETSAQVASDGTASLRMTHASQYAIVIDDKSHDLPFTDLGENQWYEAAVRYAYIHDIMEGMSAKTFSPNTSLTRAEAVQVLYNLEGRPAVSGNAAFPDLVEKWYKPAIAWAEQTGVVDGYEDGTFRPENAVTRQEFAQMLYNYAKYKGYDLNAKGDLTAFPDGDSVQPWAETAMTWANGNALINGHDDGTLEPGGTTTRAQAASILMRFDQNVVEN